MTEERASIVTPRTRGEPPDITRLADLLGRPLDIRSFGITILAVLALFYTLYFSRAFLLPLVLALLLKFLLSPAVRTLKTRLGLREPLGAILVLAALVAALVYGVYMLSRPAAAWLHRIPDTVHRLEATIARLQEPVERVTAAAETVEQLTKMSDRGKHVQEVRLDRPGLSEGLLDDAQSVLFGTVMLFILLYFLLASGELFLGKLVKVLPRLEDKVHAVQIFGEVENQVFRYLFTMTLINIGLGTAVGIAMALFGLPDPLLWGVVAGLMNFVPYLGPIVTSGIIALVGLATFETVTPALLAAFVAWLLNAIEGSFVTPFVVGKRLTLNPVVIFLGLTFWGWMWGIAGSLLAVPLLATFKIFCDHIEPLAPIGEFLGE
jgi:predicted PurR-regulated permease PerM